MRKAIFLILVLVFVFSFAGCSNKLNNNIDNTAKLEIIQYDVSDGAEKATVTVTDSVNINHIADNLQALKLKKLEYNDPTVLEYKLIFCNTDGEEIEIISVPVNDWLELDGSFYSIASGELDRAYIARFFKPTEYHGKYADDSSLLVISSEAEIIADKIMSHYENGGIVLATYWTYAEQIQEILAPAVTTSFSASDTAVLFYKTANAAPVSSTIVGNMSDMDAEIDELIENARGNQ